MFLPFVALRDPNTGHVLLESRRGIEIWGSKSTFVAAGLNCVTTRIFLRGWYKKIQIGVICEIASDERIATAGPLTLGSLFSSRTSTPRSPALLFDLAIPLSRDGGEDLLERAEQVLKPGVSYAIATIFLFLQTRVFRLAAYRFRALLRQLHLE